jgi:hypothetical protein
VKAHHNIKMQLTLRSSVGASDNTPIHFRNHTDIQLRSLINKHGEVGLHSIHFIGSKPTTPMFVSCNISDYQFIGDLYSTILSLYDPDVPVTVIHQPIKLLHGQEYIEIELLDLTLKPLKLPKVTETLVVLELRKSI